MDDRPRDPTLELSRRRALASLALATGLSGCLSSMSPGDGGVERLASDRERVAPDVEDDAVDRLVDDTTAFALDLHRELRAARGDANLFASPYSVAVALAMTYAGARGETAAEMRDALRFDLPDEALHPAFNRLTRTIEREPDADETDGEPFTLRAANALWGQRGFPFADDYLDLLAAHYGAGLNTVDFAGSAETARLAINEWVAERTEGRIEELMGPDAVGPRTRLVLTNAIYFLASWAEPFDEADTEPRPFTGLDGATTEVPMMHQEHELGYAAVDGHQAVELPYVGGSASMVVVLPEEGRFEAFVRELNRAGLDELIGSLQRSKGRLALPRFTYESSFSLAGALEDLGMERVFDAGRADLSGMVESQDAAGELYVQDVVHKAFVAVDEAGTEAAAATGVSVGIISVSPGSGWELVVDRPFVFLIRDRRTDAVLFLGTVVDPDQLG